MNPRKLAIATFFGSVVLNATLGIFALFAGDFGELQGQILLTSLSVSAGSVLSLAMFPARERGNLGPVPPVGIGLTIIGFALFIGLVWSDFRGEVLGKTAGTFLAFAVAAGYASLISLASVQSRFSNVINAGYWLAGILAVLITTAFWGEPGGDIMPRIMGVNSILLAAATVSIPVLHRLNRMSGAADSSEASDQQRAEHVFLGQQPTICLKCGEPWESRDDNARLFECSSCSALFDVEIRL